ncbi:MAG TPA: transglutaminase-like cysteine peptidase [Xanthobacteraceae bacterium]|nr:transglutaminase-like cysteine peptidase [Xanthobacteraceae bacterium]
MLLRIAAWWFAAFLVAIEVPAFAGIETGPVANTNLSATTAVIEAPMGQAAITGDMPNAAPPEAAAPQRNSEAKIEAPNEASVEPGRRAETLASVAIAMATAIEPDGQAQNPADPHAPVKLAALETPVITPPVSALPPLAPPPGELPHIDISFRFNILPVSHGNVLVKWNGVRAAMRAESEVFARCRADMESCPLAAKRFLAIVDQGRTLTGRARIGVVNRAINMAIEPVSDMAQWGVPDRWSAPLETFTTGKGDCEDYAIAKYAALIETGIATDDVKLMIVRNSAANEDHAVTAVRIDGAWIILDNRWLRLVEDTAMPQAVPLYVLGSDGVRQYLPDVLVGERQTPAPASIAN